jgi:uncharacterized protein (UPF0335 family)
MPGQVRRLARMAARRYGRALFKMMGRSLSPIGDHIERKAATTMDDFDEAPKSGTPPAPRPADVGGIAGEQLRAIIDRIERLEEEKKALAEDIKDVFAEAKGNGFDTKIIRKIISIRKRDRNELDEEETMLEVYMRALGMLPDIDEEA